MLCAPGVPAKSEATNGNNHRGMIFHAWIPITDLSSKKNIEGEIPFPFKPNVPPQKPKACGNNPDWKGLSIYCSGFSSEM